MNSQRFRLIGLLPVLALALTVSSCEEDEQVKNARQYDVTVLKKSSRQLISSYSATIRGKQDIDIRPKVSGYITEINVREGAVVHKGQTLFVIDQTNYQSELETATANVNVANAAVTAAQLTLESKEQLYKEKIISKYDLQMARTTLAREKAGLAQAKANQTKAQNNLNYTLVKSPVDGVVGSLPFRVGTLVSPSDATPLTSVSDNSDMYVYFSMNETQVLSLTRRFESLENAIKNMPDIELQLSDGTVYPHKGRIETISGIIDPNTGAVSVRAKFPNRSRLLLSGGSGNVLIPYVAENCIVIPQAATFEVQDKNYACKYSSGSSKSTLIKVLQINDGKEFIVTQGLSVGDTILVEGAGMVKDKSKVRIKNVISTE